MMPARWPPRLLLAASLILLLWGGLVVWVAEGRYEAAAVGAVAENFERSEQEAEAVARHISRSLGSLRGMPATFSLVRRVQKSLLRFDGRAGARLPDVAARRRQWTAEPALAELNEFFARSAKELHADLLFVLNDVGECVVASNAGTPQSLVGSDFSDREYFRATREGHAGRQYAVGRRTNIPGLFYSAPVMAEGRRVGAVVVKMNVPSLAEWVEQSHVFVADDLGVVILARDKQLEFRLMPGASFSRESQAQRISRYKTAELPALVLRPLGDPRYPGLVRLGDDPTPVAMASRSLPDDLLQVYAVHPVSELAAIAEERGQFIAVMLLIGLLVVFLLAGGYLHLVRRSQAAAAIEASEARFRALFENSPVAYQSLDAQGRLVDMNERMCELVGYRRDELMGRPFGELLAPENSVPYEDLFRDFLARGAYQADLILVRKDRERVYVLGEGRIQRDRDGRFVRTHCVLHDISERKRAEEAMESLNATLARRVAEETAKSLQKERLLLVQSRHAAMGEMIGNVAHQWRQPLAVLGLLIQNLRYDFREGRLRAEELEDYVARALRAVGQMTATIDDFRDFFKPSRLAERFCVVRVIEDCLSLVDASLKHNHIAATVSGARSAELVGYPNEFSQIMLNLITNAKDAMIERKVAAGRIAIEVRCGEGEVAVTVRDNAGGIPRENLEKIFDPYFTTKEKGTGIGLYMSQTIVEQHMHGTIRAENTGDGAVFTLNLPCNQTSDGETRG